ncbi:hypothetical protein HDU96_008019 [Phlyctochytrium bullatum]|nr:hypothetical protein HDU96_008019 [Phlyctochytrium bullatum]
MPSSSLSTSPSKPSPTITLTPPQQPRQLHPHRASIATSASTNDEDDKSLPPRPPSIVIPIIETSETSPQPFLISTNHNDQSSLNASSLSIPTGTLPRTTHGRDSGEQQRFSLDLSPDGVRSYAASIRSTRSWIDRMGDILKNRPPSLASRISASSLWDAKAVLGKFRGKLAKEETPSVVVFEADNEGKVQYTDLFQWKGSILPHVYVETILLTIWAIMWWAVYTYSSFRVFFTANVLTTVLATVLSLVLIFRNNTAYATYWEGRVLWGQVISISRNLARVVWVVEGDRLCGPEAAKVAEKERRGAMNLILAFAVATKLHLRGLEGIHYNSLLPLIAHVPALHEGDAHRTVPVEVCHHLASYLKRAVSSSPSPATGPAVAVPRGNATLRFDLPTYQHYQALLNALTDAFTSLDRIRTTPLPLIYKIHLKSIVYLYLLSLPFQLMASIGGMTIPVTTIVTFIFLGIQAISLEIENPFGTDKNDLPQELYIAQISRDLADIMARDPIAAAEGWGETLEL